ncbi:MAG TPA: hypothetical protein VH853_17445 [Polyangia bacterium]|jgi:hypothetical protein|nr:hypothetical protein [Polyangia bacterium]
MKSLFVVCLVLASAGLLSGCGGAAKPAPGMGCALNSDCAAGLTCTFGLCHSACVVNGDCPTGQLCVKTGVVGDAGTVNVCQLPKELNCVYNSDCKSPLVCARDEQCRNECESSVDCVSPQVCTNSKVCALTSQLVPGTNDVQLVTTGQTDGGAAGSKGSGGAGGGAVTGTGGSAGATGQGGAGGSGGSACAGPQIEFANISQGDANPGFTSSVAVRNADTLFIFSVYGGPAPVDGGTDGGALAGDAMFVQMFDPVSGDTRGPNKFLFSIPYGVVAAVEDVSVAPTGEIALLYYVVAAANNYADALYLTVLGTTAADGGVAGLTVKKTVQLESAANGDGHIIWQTASQLFVPSWKYLGSNGTWYVRVRKFHPDGTAAGTAINAFPTFGSNYQPNQEDDGYVGASGPYLGMAYQSTNNNWPYLTIVDSDGFQVGPIVSLNPGGVDNWVAGAGTTEGFVTMFTSGGRIYGTFVPLTGMSSVISDGGTPDAGVAPLPMFSFTSTALTGKLINDDAGGAGGVGAVLLEDDGAGFVYVNADGSKQYTEGTVINASGGIQAGISNFQGSFVVSLFNNTTHASQATVSICPQP